MHATVYVTGMQSHINNSSNQQQLLKAKQPKQEKGPSVARAFDSHDKHTIKVGAYRYSRHLSMVLRGPWPLILQLTPSSSALQPAPGVVPSCRNLGSVERDQGSNQIPKMSHCIASLHHRKVTFPVAKGFELELSVDSWWTRWRISAIQIRLSPLVLSFRLR